jgi:glycosyltransferase involved in cell wall biosynthesis
MKILSIIIPVFNEEATLLALLERVFASSTIGFEKEIIFINDGSIDGSRKILENQKAKHDFILINQPENRGKGAAIREGFARSSGEIILIQDADLEYDPNDWEIILREFDDPATSVVFGSRNIHPERQGYWHYVLGVRILTSLINWFFASKLTDSYTCFKAFRKEIVSKLDLESDGFEIEAEICCKVLRFGYPIKEVAISYNPRNFKNGKKIGFMDGIIGIWTIFKNSP